MVDEQTVSFLSILDIGTSSLGITIFPKLAFFGASFSYLITSVFALDGSSIPIDPLDSSNFNFPSSIKLWTLFLKVLQSSIEWPGIPAW